MSKVRSLALSSLLTALAVGLLYLAGLIGAARLSLVAAAALLPAVAVIHCGVLWGTGVYAASSLLALLLLPDKAAALWFVLVLGHYGVMKSLIERIGKRPVEWLLKLLLFAACTALLYFMFRTSFFGALPSYAELILFVALAICFVLYDIAFTALISIYCRRIAPHVEQ